MTQRARTLMATGLALGLCCTAAACGSRLSRADLLATSGHFVTVTGSPDAAASPGGAVVGSDTSGDGAPVAGTPTSGAVAGGVGQSVPTSPVGGGGATVGAVTPVTTASGAAPVTGATAGPRATAKGSGETKKATAAPKASTSATQAAGQTSAASAPCTAQAPIIVGQTGSFSGLVGAAVSGGKVGLAVWAKDVNSRGGIACHQVQLYQLDDGSDSSKSASNAQTLYSDDHVVTYAGIFDPIAISGFRSVADKIGVPAVGGDGIPDDWNQDPLLFPVGGGTLATYTGAVKYAVQQGQVKAAQFYCVEASACTSAHDAASQIFGDAGANLVYQTQISITQSDYTAECQNAQSAGAQQILVNGDGSSIQRIASSCASLSYHPWIIGQAVEFSISQGQDSNLQADHFTLASSTVPWMQSDTPGAQAFTAAMAKYAPGTAADGSASLGYQSGRMLEAAIAQLGPAARTEPITTAMILQGLGMIKNETLGGGTVNDTYTPGKATPAVPCYFVVTLKGSSFVAPNGSTPSCIS